MTKFRSDLGFKLLHYRALKTHGKWLSIWLRLLDTGERKSELKDLGLTAQEQGTIKERDGEKLKSFRNAMYALLRERR